MLRKGVKREKLRDEPECAMSYQVLPPIFPIVLRSKISIQ